VNNLEVWKELATFKMATSEGGVSSAMYKNNRRDSSKSKGCSPLQNRIGLIGLKPATAYFAYTKRWA